MSHYFQSAKLYTGHIQCGDVIAWQLYFPHLSKTYLFVYLFNIFYKCALISIHKGFSALALEVHFPAEFSCSPNQTQVNKIIKIFRITRNVQTGQSEQGWRKVDLEGQS